jgi:protein TonB
MPPLSEERRLWIACGAAALFHLALLFGLRFSIEPPAPASLEVTLVATPGSQAPVATRVLAPVAGTGGGRQRELRAPAARAGSPFELAGLRHAADLAMQSAATQPGGLKTLTTQNAAEQSRSTRENTPQTGQDPAQRLQRRVQAGDSSASIELHPSARAASDDNPAAATGITARASRQAAYRERWRQQVERAGSANFPWSALTTGQPRSLTLQVTVRADGVVTRSRVLRSSGLPPLDQAALDILRAAGPFPPFPDELRRDAVELSFVYDWEFLPGDRAALRIGN